MYNCRDLMWLGEHRKTTFWKIRIWVRKGKRKTRRVWQMHYTKHGYWISPSQLLVTLAVLLKWKHAKRELVGGYETQIVSKNKTQEEKVLPSRSFIVEKKKRNVSWKGQIQEQKHQHSLPVSSTAHPISVYNDNSRWTR